MSHKYKTLSENMDTSYQTFDNPPGETSDGKPQEKSQKGLFHTYTLRAMCAC